MKWSTFKEEVDDALKGRGIADCDLDYIDVSWPDDGLSIVYDEHDRTVAVTT
jgi:hypothetical protein